MISVDLRAAVLEQGQPAYMIHPGKNYHLFAAFLGQGVVAPDLPLLSIPDGMNPRSHKSLETQIVRARGIRDWLAMNSTQRAETEIKVPLSDYADQKVRRYHDSYVDHMNSILWDLPEGSVIFVPNSDLAGTGFFCELESRMLPRKRFVGSREAKRFEYLGRPVRNIERVPMRFVPPEILDSKTRQSVVTQLDEELSERVFRLYYGSFSVVGGVTQVEIDIPSERFRPVDATVLSGVANVMESNLQRFEAGEMEATDFVDALFLAFDEAELQLHARLNSPGIVQIAAKSVTPMLMSVLVCLSGHATAQELADEAAARAQDNAPAVRAINLTNSKCPLDVECPRLIENRLFGILDMMGEDEIARVCERVEQFKQRTGATTDAQVE